MASTSSSVSFFGRVVLVTLVASAATATTGCKRKTRPPVAVHVTSAPIATTPDEIRAALPAPASGTGHLYGRVRFGGAPAAGIEVKLCREFNTLRLSGPACEGPTTLTRTDANGDFAFRDLAPATYGAVLVRVFDSASYQYMFGLTDVGGAKKHTVRAGLSTDSGTIDLVKTDLVLHGPKGMARTSAQPTFHWAAYPGASAYRVSLSAGADEPHRGAPIEARVTQTSFTPEVPLSPGRWKLKLTAQVERPGDKPIDLAEPARQAEIIVPAADDATPLDDPSAEATEPPRAPPPPEMTAPTPPAGRGAVQGAVLFDERPVAGIEVKLCETLTTFWVECGGQKLVTKTDAHGVYTFASVPPGDWQGLTVKVFDTRQVMIVPAQKVASGGVTTAPPTHLVKSDLRVTSPRAGARVTSPRVEAKWAPYPGAAYYQLSVAADPYRALPYSGIEVTGPRFVLDKPLDNGRYELTITAFNARGKRLADSSTVKFTVAAR